MGKIVGSVFVSLRKGKHLSQDDVANALGVTRHTVANWETGRSEARLSVRQIKTLAQLLGVSVEDLPDDFGPQNSVGYSWLKQRRLQRSLSKEDLSKALSKRNADVPVGEIAAWEESGEEPSLTPSQTFRLCKELGISIELLAECFRQEDEEGEAG